MKYIKTIKEFYHFTDQKLFPESIPDYYKWSPAGRLRDFYDETIVDFKENYRQEDWDKILHILIEDCSEFMEELVSTQSDPIFRGVDSNNIGLTVPNGDEFYNGLWVKTPPKKRKPKDMKLSVSDAFDEAFKYRFGVKLRSDGVFATKVPDDAKSYGHHQEKKKSVCYLFFPIGNYSLYWSPDVRDLYSDTESEHWYMVHNGDLDWGDESLYSEEWSVLYGEPRYDGISPKGQYVYKDIKTGETNKELAANYISRILDEGGLEEDSIQDQLIWVPEIEYGDWLDVKREETDNMGNVEIERLVNTYVEGRLDENTDQEITFVCKKYYLVDVAFLSKLLEFIKSKKNIS